MTPSLESAARFRASYERRPTPKPSRADELAEFRALVLSKVGRLTPKWPTQIIADIDACPRRIERAIRWLREHGEIVRTADGYLLRRVRRVA